MSIENQLDLGSLQHPGGIVTQTLREMKRALRLGITTAERDGWTMKTKDGSLAAHFERTVIVGRAGGRVATA